MQVHYTRTQPDMNYNTVFQSQAYHLRVCVVTLVGPFCFCDLDLDLVLDPMTLVYELDLHILKTY